MDDRLLITKCPNGCNSILKETNISVSEGNIRECTACGQMVSSCGKDFYKKTNQEWNTEDGTWPSKKDYARLFKRRKRDIRYISKILSKPLIDIHILDVGCSNGSSVFIASELGLNAEGVEPSEKAVQNGKDRGLNIHLGFLHDVDFASNTFDAITLYEVIEHVTDPIPMLKECHRILRPGGILLIGTGNTHSWTRLIRKGKWDFFNMSQHGGHISFFSTKSISVLASHTDFTVVKTKTSSVKFYEKGEVPSLLYRLFKIFSELLNFPSKIFTKGHQMEVFLRACK